MMGPGSLDSLQTGDGSGNGTGNMSWYPQVMHPGAPMEPGLDGVRENAGNGAARTSGTMTFPPIVTKMTTFQPLKSQCR